MNFDRAEALMWATFPKADAVVVQHVDRGHVGIGVQFGEFRKGISFNPRLVRVRAAIAQLQEQVAATLA